MHVLNLTNHKFVYLTAETGTPQLTEMPNATDYRCWYQKGLYHQYEKQLLNKMSHSMLPKLSIEIHNSLEHTQQEGNYLAKLKLNYQHY